MLGGMKSQRGKYRGDGKENWTIKFNLNNKTVTADPFFV